MRLRTTLTCLAATGSILGAGIAQAEELAGTTLDTITVTANKQEENIQEVPMSITAFDELTLEDKNITSVGDFTDYVPNLILNGESNYYSRPSMRGIMNEVGSDVSTAMFVDGVPILSAYGFDSGTLQNIERVEVLRGPQGTLYGKGTAAGAINIITRQPDNDFRGKVSLDYGEDNKKEASLNVSGPVVQDKLFFGVSGLYYEKDGWIKNEYTGDHENNKAHWYGQSHLRWTPTASLDINFIFSQLEYDNDGCDSGLSEDGAITYGVPLPGHRVVYSGSDVHEKSNSNTEALKISYDFDDTLNLTSITTHRSFEGDFTTDFDFYPEELTYTTDDEDLDKISQELRLSSNTEKMNWVAGIYYDKDDDAIKTKYNSYESNRDFGGEAYALFGQLRYALTPKIAMTGGLRYEKQDKDMDDKINLTSKDDTWEDISPKFSLDYALTKQVMGYATVAKGFRSGGFNVMSRDPKYDSYDSEKLWSYETGIKSQFFEDRLILNGALFYMDIDDMQVKEWTDGSNYITNVGTGSSYGFELEAQARITTQFTMTANFGYTNVEYDEYNDGKIDYSNNTAPNVPEYTFAIGGKYRAGNGFFVGADLIGVGAIYLDKTNTYKRDPYQLVNTKIGYEAETWDIYLYGKNIFDEDYSSEGASTTFYSDPRELGVKLTYRF